MKLFRKKAPKYPSLFLAAAVGFAIEITEVVRDTCGIWMQEFALLAAIGMIAFVAAKNRALDILAIVVVLGFYAFEIYEQVFEGEVCGDLASGLNPLLLALLITAASRLAWRK